MLEALVRGDIGYLTTLPTSFRCATPGRVMAETAPVQRVRDVEGDHPWAGKKLTDSAQGVRGRAFVSRIRLSISP